MDTDHNSTILPSPLGLTRGDLAHSELNFHSQTSLYKIYLTDRAVIKRTLRPHEQTHHDALPPPGDQARERLINEAAALRLIKGVTNVPVAGVLAEYEDDGAYVLVTEAPPDGVQLSTLENDEKKATALDQLRRYIEAIHRLGSHLLGSLSGHVILPGWVIPPSESIVILASHPGERFVVIHGDLKEENVIVDPQTYMIKAIVGWETAGFWPEWVEGREFRRMGPGASWWVTEEGDDVQERMGMFLRARAIRPW